MMTMKTFLGIGSGLGIGLATAQRFASEGFRTVLTGRSLEKLAEVAAKLKTEGHIVETAAVDASSPEAVRALIVGLVERHGAIDVMHYNAASLRRATIEDQPTDTFVFDLAVNIGGAMVAIQALEGPMAARGEGTILLTGGGLAFTPFADFISLSIGKAGLRTLALGLFESFKTKGIHIGIVNVAAMVAAGSQTSANVADEFWKLHESPKDQWVAEVTYS
jgi:short-subunit dehydrogenase